MSRIVAVHSFRGGTGKSNAVANIATLLALGGQRVAVVDTDIQSPGIHVLFGVDQEGVRYSLNDFLWGGCSIEQAIRDVTPLLLPDGPGRLWLIPASLEANAIARVMRQGYDVGLLNQGFRRLIAELSVDTLILDTHPGLNEETLLSIAMADALVVVLRPDQQDYEGTGVTVTLARKLKVPRLVLVVNKTPESFEFAQVKERVESTYGCDVAAVIPHSEDLMVLSSAGVFVLRHPEHPVTSLYRTIADRLMEQ